MSAASVTLTYNAVHLVSHHVEALLRQTRPLDEIIIVDNASTDGTCALLAEHYPQVTLLRMSQNLGVGGGLGEGMAYATLKKRHDWVWTFDADSIPGDRALQALLEGMGSLGNAGSDVGMVASLLVNRETGMHYTPWYWRNGYVRPSADSLRQPILFADLVCTSGCMVRREVVEKIGLPRQDFFIDFVDTEYCLRARSRDYRIAVVTASEVEHKMGHSRRVRSPVYSCVRIEHEPWRHYYIARNITYSVWMLYPSVGSKLYLMAHLARRAFGLLLFDSNKLPCLEKMVQGIGDGLKGRLGVRFRP